MPLPKLPRIISINGWKEEEGKKLRNVETPDQERDATNKKYVDNRGTFTSTGDVATSGYIELKDSGGTTRRFMIRT